MIAMADTPDLLTQLRQRARQAQAVLEDDGRLRWTPDLVESLRRWEIDMRTRAIYRRPPRRDAWRRT